MCRQASGNSDMRSAVITIHRDFVLIVAFPNLESRVMMLPRKEPAARQCVQSRRRVPARDEYAASPFAILIPFHCDPMSGVFRRDTKYRRRESGANVFQPDQANACHAKTIDEPGLEWRRQHMRQDIAFDAEVNQNPAVDDAAHNGNSNCKTLQQFKARKLLA